MKGFCGECGRRYACDIDPDKCDEWPDPVPMTNAQKIRAMSDEELAEKIKDCPYFWNDYYDPCYSDKDCFSCILEWLRKPAEDERGERNDGNGNG